MGEFTRANLYQAVLRDQRTCSECTDTRCSAQPCPASKPADTKPSQPCCKIRPLTRPAMHKPPLPQANWQQAP